MSKKASINIDTNLDVVGIGNAIVDVLKKTDDSLLNKLSLIKGSMNLIDEHMINRSNRAIKCLYFNSEFYKKVKVSGLSAENIYQEQEKSIKGQVTLDELEDGLS